MIIYLKLKFLGIIVLDLLFHSLCCTNLNQIWNAHTWEVFRGILCLVTQSKSFKIRGWTLFIKELLKFPSWYRPLTQQKKLSLWNNTLLKTLCYRKLIDESYCIPAVIKENGAPWYGFKICEDKCVSYHFTCFYHIPLLQIH